MSPDKINELLDKLNETVFKGSLEIEFSPDAIYWDESLPGVWEIGVGNYEPRCCWLNTKRSWEIRHSGMGDFMWWVDAKITNEIALEFNGTISDEGIEDKWKGTENYCPTFLSHLEKMYAPHPLPKFNTLVSRTYRQWMIWEAIQAAPPEHRVKLEEPPQIGTL